MAETEARVSEEHRFPCEECGADLLFAPGQTELKCPYCGHVQTIPEADGHALARALTEHDLRRGLADDLPDAASESVRTVSCPSCGAKVEFQGADHAARCPFCDTPVVVDTGESRRLKPQALVPFQLDEKQAREALIAWLGRLWFAPNGLQQYTRAGRALSGIYVPYWTFDAGSESQYRGAKGIHYYETQWVTVTVNGKTERRQQQVQKTRWYPASGTVARDFDDVLAMASTSLPRNLAEGLEPWTLSALVPYAPDYLAGFQAEGYTVALADGHGIARDKMAAVIREDVRRDIGGDEQRIDSINSRFWDETFKHILLPVWMAAYKYNGKSYRFLVNGQTGEVQGERPWSAWKIAFAVLGLAIVAAVAVYLKQTYGQ